MSNWRDLTERLDGKAPPGATRSPLWSKIRNEFLRGKCCAVCGGRKSLVAHHEVPFHLAPDLELDESNLIPLCEAGRFGLNCHLLIGHLGNYQRANPIVRADVAYWRERIINSR